MDVYVWMYVRMHVCIYEWMSVLCIYIFICNYACNYVCMCVLHSVIISVIDENSKEVCDTETGGHNTPGGRVEKHLTACSNHFSRRSSQQTYACVNNTTKWMDERADTRLQDSQPLSVKYIQRERRMGGGEVCHKNSRTLAFIFVCLRYVNSSFNNTSKSKS